MKAIAPVLVVSVWLCAAVLAAEPKLFSYHSSGELPSGRTYSIRIAERPYVPRPIPKNEIERLVRHAEAPDSIWERLVVHNSFAGEVQ